MDFNALWLQIQPWVAVAVQIVTVLGGGTVTVAAVKRAILALLSKRTGELTSADLVSAIAENVVRGIAKKAITVDIKSVVETEVKTLAEAAVKRIETSFQQLNADLYKEVKSLKTVSVGVADLLVRGRDMTEAAKAELLATVTTERGALPEEPKEPIVIELDDHVDAPEAVKAASVIEVKPKNTIAFG